MGGAAGRVRAHRQFSMSYIGLRRPRGASIPAAPLLALAGATPLGRGRQGLASTKASVFYRPATPVFADCVSR